MRHSRNKSPLPVRSGISPNSVFLPAGEWPTLLAFLVQRFPAVSHQQWQQRMEQGNVVDKEGQSIQVDSAYPAGQRIYYYRAVAAETPVPFGVNILYEDARILVADKPHFLATQPSGSYLQETLITRLRKQLGRDDLVALHRLDRDTAGLVLVAKDPASRDAYHQLFREHRVQKVYEAVAPVVPGLTLPCTYRSCIGPAPQFYRRQEVEGEPNAVTQLALMAQHNGMGRYQIMPVTGKTHQIRIHMAALGIPILNDVYYPQESARAPDDFSRPLQLLARALDFVDPVTGEVHHFESGHRLDWPLPS